MLKVTLFLVVFICYDIILCEVLWMMLKLETDFASCKESSNLIRGRWDETFYYFHAVTPYIHLK